MQSRVQPPSEAAQASLQEQAIALAGITRTFTGGRGGQVRALEDVSLHAGHGQLLALVGPSGCGKTTLLELICGLQAPQQGSIACEAAVLMPQRDLLLPWLSALDNAALALRIAHVSRADARERAAVLFAELGLSGFERSHPAELSGGMRQRVAFLRTLLSGKPILCLDEPFGALDAITRAEMQDWLARALEREPRTVVLVTHDVEEAILLADRVLVLSPRPGRIVAEIEIDTPRPRARTDGEVVALRERALDLLSEGARTTTASA
jgi:ABC-type nitrate/sulfonate/bicarbonate transport system ATPase subunit